MSGKEKQTSRKLRFILDALLSLILLLAVFVALSSRMANREVTRFRRAEKAALVGPSEILDRIDVREEWPSVNYDRLLIGDDGEEILFYLIPENGNGFLWRREKTDGILLTPLYNVNWVFGTPRRRDGVLPLFLFSDEPEAVRAEVQIRLSDTFPLWRRLSGPGDYLQRRDQGIDFRIGRKIMRGRLNGRPRSVW